MWLYHRSGGDGLQMTKKRTDQKDSGEPVFSPDGKYLYFSDDITPGQIYEYNKDPNKEIYVIQRLERESGDVRALRHRTRRLDPPDAVAGRQDARVHPARPLQVDALRARPRVWARDRALRRPRSRHAGDVGDPRRLSADGLDAGQQVDRLLGRRQDPAHRRRLEAGREHSRST